MELTQEYLKTILKYDPETGIFIWIVRIANNIHIGDIAGSLDKQSGYIRLMIDEKNYRAHRLAWLYMIGDWPIYKIDHKDKCKNNNKFSNLRDIPHGKNMFNLGEYKNNTSGYNGVYLNNNKTKWKSQIGVNNTLIHLGTFSTKEEAFKAYEEAKIKYHIIDNSEKI